MKLWLATCAPGLEKVLAEELSTRAGWKTLELRRGAVRAEGEGRASLWNPASPDAFRTADNIYLWLGAFPAGPVRADLPALGAAALAALRNAAPLPTKAVVRVTASRKGKHSYSRFEAADAVEKALCAALGWLPGDEERHDIALRLDIDERRASISWKQSDASFRFRGARAFASGAIRPTVAAALVRLAKPQPGERMLDPCAGSGTLPLEWAALMGENAPRPLGFDVDAERVALARSMDTDSRVCWAVGDAMKLPLEADSVDCLLSNPPWNHQLPLHDVDGFYRGLLREARRVLRPGGRMLLLTDVPLARERGAETVCLAELSLHGLHPRVTRVTFHPLGNP